MNIHQILYKKTSSGAVQIWYAETKGAYYRTCSGQQNGKIVISEDTCCLPKNIGKANETTAEQQCELEVAALYKKKLAQGNYKENINDIETANFFQPMLAKIYSDYEPSDDMFAQGKVFCQPKYDGICCIVNSNGMWSRQGKPIVSAPHIYKALEPYFENNEDIVFHGELYNHDLKDNFNEIISLTRKAKPTAEDLELSKKFIQYYIYDFPSKKPYSERYEALISAMHFPPAPDCLKLVPTFTPLSKENLNKYHSMLIEQGYEGSMIRIDGHPYENKRVNHLLKKKDFLDADYPIVRIEEGVGGRSNMAGSVVYSAPDGTEFGSGIAGGVDFYRDLWEHRESYVGGVGTVKYFHLTPTSENGGGNLPRFPVTIKVYKGTRDI